LRAAFQSWLADRQAFKPTRHAEIHAFRPGRLAGIEASQAVNH
jgi:hypothetical protein